MGAPGRYVRWDDAGDAESPMERFPAPPERPSLNRPDERFLDRKDVFSDR
jgi:hypothetical protein